MDFEFDPLPQGFVLSKPVQWGSYDESVIYELQSHNRLVIQRKRDGYSLRAVWHKGRVKMYTSGNTLLDGRVDHICKELEGLFSQFKGMKGTILAGEGILDIGSPLPFQLDGKDDFEAVTSFFKAGYDEAMRVQKERGMLRLMVFNLVAYDGGLNEKAPYGKTYQQLRALLNSKPLKYVTLAAILPYDYDAAKEAARNNKWEGLVLYDTDFKLQVRMDGKDPKRPKGCYKWKPLFEDDFIVRAEDRIWNPDKPGRLKEVILRQKDPADGREFACFKLGTFSEKMREFLTDGKNFPLVMKVEFEQRFPKTGKLRFPRFDSIRDDKPLHHCIAPQSYPKAQYCK